MKRSLSGLTNRKANIFHFNYTKKDKNVEKNV